MENVVDRFVEKHQLLKTGATVVIAVSGGPDSMALLHYFMQREKRWHLRLIVAHVNHMLRGKQSEADFHYVETFCQNRNLLFEGKHIDVSAYKQRYGLSTQVAARECRYQFFKDVMKKYEAEFLALGHHGDDQIETMVMRQVRGALGNARAGIPVKRSFANGMIIRPFLCLEKSEIEDYLERVNISPRIDPSNEEHTYMRNRIRRRVLPVFKQENPKVHERFQQQSEWLLEDEAYFISLAKQHAEKMVKCSKEGQYTICIREFLSLAIPLQRRVVQLLLNCLYHHERLDITTVHMEQIIRLFQSENPSGVLHLPAGLYVIRSYEHVTFTFTFTPDEGHPQPFSHHVQFPFELTLPHGVMIGRLTKQRPEITNDNEFVGDGDAIKWPLTVRSRKAGDRMVPIGMEGSKKVKSILIDEKIDKYHRAFIPIVADSHGNILWIAGVKRAKWGLVTERTTTFIHIVYKKDNGVGLNREDKEQHGK